MTFFNTAFLLALILLLSGCPSIMKIDLRNDSSEPIAVVYETEYESEIAPGISAAPQSSKLVNQWLEKIGKEAQTLRLIQKV